MEGYKREAGGDYLGNLFRRIPRPFLEGASLVYGFGVRTRLFLYRKRVLPSRRAPVKVLSIGNLTVGGSGKTPHAALLARYLRDKGVRTAILSRGYGGTKTKKGAVLSDGRSVLGTWEEGGEEPLWLAKEVPGVPVLVGRDRFRSALYCRQTWRTEWVVLDDGFQHLQLQRDLDILLIPADKPLGNNRLLPLGTLREPVEEVKRADVILLTHMERSGPDLNKGLRETIGRLAPYAPIYASFHRPVRLTAHPSGNKVPLSFLKDKPIVAFCGLGDPGSFAHTLGEIGAKIIRLVPLADHHRYRGKDKAVLENLCRELKIPWMVTTEKDALKLEDWKPKGAELLVLGIAIEIPDKGFWELMDRLIGREA